MQTKVKICGIRDLSSAQTAYDAGADYLGFIFAPESRRCVTPNTVTNIHNALGKKISFVGVFKNQPLREVNSIIKNCALTYVQLHGNESPEYCRQVQAKVIKAVPADVAQLAQYSVDYFLLDRKYQGEGHMVDIDKATKIAKKYPIFFAGGLDANNVVKVINTVQPYAVDISGGVETNGQKDPEKMREFIAIVKGKTR